MSTDEVLATEEEEATVYYGGTVTVNGRDLLANLMQGETIELTRIMVGDGAIPSGVEPIDMEDLVNPLYEAQSTVPVVKDNTMYMTVEYRNDMNGGLNTGFWLREFGIYAKTDQHEEVLLYYATLGNSPQPVNAFRDNRVDTRRYPISISLALDAEVTVTYNPGAFITAEDAEQMLSALVEEAMESASAVKVVEITIPTEGWSDGTAAAPEDNPDGEDDPEPEVLGLHIDIPVEGATAEMVPLLTIAPNSLNAAKACELCHTSETVEGALRVFSANIPAEPIEASLALLTPYGGKSGGGGGSYVLPTATETRLGGVKIGEGFKVASDGTISVDQNTVFTDDDLLDEDATEEDLRQILTGETGGNEEAGESGE